MLNVGPLVICDHVGTGSNSPMVYMPYTGKLKSKDLLKNNKPLDFFKQACLNEIVIRFML